ncbi:MAG: diacylglycerol kinase family protein [Ginsengibacter sp.]
MKQNKFSINKMLKSFVYAFNGLWLLLKEEQNARIHFVASVIVILAGFYFGLNAYEWMAILFSIGLVITVEIINTAIENIADFISPGKNEHIKTIKDISAAAVLISAIVAVSIGLIVFLPKLLF